MVLALLRPRSLWPSATCRWPRARRAGGAARRDRRRLVGGGALQRVGRRVALDRGARALLDEPARPITPTGWSRFLPDLPRATAGQDFEGFQYLGSACCCCWSSAVLAACRPPGRLRRGIRQPSVARFRRAGVPGRAGMAVFALSPRITVGRHLWSISAVPWAARFAVFRATGRFFWPLATCSSRGRSRRSARACPRAWR